MSTLKNKIGIRFALCHLPGGMGGGDGRGHRPRQAHGVASARRQPNQPCFPLSAQVRRCVLFNQ
jgi:hypothetical protein